MLKLEDAEGLPGTVAGLDADESIDLGDFLFSGSPTINGSSCTGDKGTGPPPSQSPAP
jgi:hypothetical protein